MKQVIYGTVIEGHLTRDADLRFLTALATNTGKDVKITVERGRKRSLNQNSYYFGVVVPAVQDMLIEYGNDVDTEETHSFLKEHVGKLVSAVTDKRGRRMAIVKSSTALSSKEWEEYMERIKRWAAQEGVYIPDPNEDKY